MVDLVIERCAGARVKSGIAIAIKRTCRPVNGFCDSKLRDVSYALLSGKYGVWDMRNGEIFCAERVTCWRMLRCLRRKV
jgi:hypothetical protein